MYARGITTAVVAFEAREVTIRSGQAYDVLDPFWSGVIKRWPDYFDVPEVETGAKKGRK